jgi:hypothetical protein
MHPVAWSTTFSPSRDGQNPSYSEKSWKFQITYQIYPHFWWLKLERCNNKESSWYLNPGTISDQQGCTIHGSNISIPDASVNLDSNDGLNDGPETNYHGRIRGTWGGQTCTPYMHMDVDTDRYRDIKLWSWYIHYLLIQLSSYYKYIYTHNITQPHIYWCTCAGSFAYYDRGTGTFPHLSSCRDGVFKSQATEAPLGPQPWWDGRYMVCHRPFFGYIVVTSGMSYL